MLCILPPSPELSPTSFRAGEYRVADLQSMGGFLAMVERDFADEILYIREPIRRELNITYTVLELE
jgi:hypothetical protein